MREDSLFTDFILYLWLQFLNSNIAIQLLSLEARYILVLQNFAVTVISLWNPILSTEHVIQIHGCAHVRIPSMYESEFYDPALCSRHTRHVVHPAYTNPVTSPQLAFHNFSLPRLIARLPSIVPQKLLVGPLVEQNLEWRLVKYTKGQRVHRTRPLRGM